MRVSREDRVLVDRILERDERAFALLVERYQGRLLGLAAVFVGSPSVAEEVVQETWMAVLTGLKGFEGRSSLKTWIFRILANRAKSRATREGRTIPFSSLPHSEEGEGPAVSSDRFTRDGSWAIPPAAWDAETPERNLLRQEAMRRLREALDGLPPGQKAVVTLRDVEGLDAEEACNILDLSETNQRVLLHRGRSKVREALEDYFEKD